MLLTLRVARAVSDRAAVHHTKPAIARQSGVLLKGVPYFGQPAISARLAIPAALQLGLTGHECGSIRRIRCILRQPTRRSLVHRIGLLIRR